MDYSEFIVCNLRSNKKIHVFRVTRPYLNILVKPRMFFRFSEKKNYNFMHFERRISECISYIFYIFLK